MKIVASFKALNHLERILWLTSVVLVTVSFLVVPERDYLTLTASLIGVTALIFVAKGLVLGQILTVVFAVFYGIISYYFRYYGEMITYLCMTSPIAVMAAISWYRHPYRDTDEVEVSGITGKQAVILVGLTVLVTVLFYFILAALGNANLLLLDEPSSHLDIYAQFALEKALNAYRGAVLMVSHDFYTITNCVDRILYVDNGTIRPMSGRAFRKMIYKNHFSHDYLEHETRRKELETKIARCLEAKNCDEAETLCAELEELIQKS